MRKNKYMLAIEDGKQDDETKDENRNVNWSNLMEDEWSGRKMTDNKDSIAKNNLMHECCESKIYIIALC